MKSCMYCLWDITQDGTGQWRLAWATADDDVQPYDCDGSSEGRHAPAAEELEAVSYIPAEDPGNGPCPHCGLWKPLHDFQCPDRWDGPLRKQREEAATPQDRAAVPPVA